MIFPVPILTLPHICKVTFKQGVPQFVLLLLNPIIFAIKDPSATPSRRKVKTPEERGSLPEEHGYLPEELCYLPWESSYLPEVHLICLLVDI